MNTSVANFGQTQMDSPQKPGCPKNPPESSHFKRFSGEKQYVKAFAVTLGF